ncbi:MAG: hypothetical protein ACRDJP_14065 [Actinomycetota bacterium]
MSRLRLFAFAASVVVLGAFGVVAIAQVPAPEVPRPCPPGYLRISAEELFAEFGGAAAGVAESAALESGEAAGVHAYCLNQKHPETFAELEGLRNEMAARTYAPWNGVSPEAYPAAIQEREAMERRSRAPGVYGSSSFFLPYGRGPLISNDPRYPNVENNGFVKLSGRVDSLDYDAANNRLFAVIGTGGVWMSTDLGQSWKSIGDNLPTQILGAVAWTPAGGGRVVVVGGEHLMGGNTYTGIGAFWSNDLGKTWHQSSGVPSGILGFQVAVDPTNPSEVYVATSKGLFRSVNAGNDFQNVNLPTADCAGKTDDQECLLANYVTDVVVQTPDNFGNTGGEVVAAVGYRAGNRPYPQDPSVIESPCNGLFRSSTGDPGSFVNLGGNCGDSPPGFTPFERIGRVELGVADGPQQNHDYLYAIVGDAELFRGGPQAIDAPEGEIGALPNSTNINGIYVSEDFGESWTQMANTDQIAFNPATGSALFAVSPLIAPGVQAWYNEWIKVDPTRQTAAGVPTRINFGLEEVWQNRLTNVAQDGPSDFRVIGRYFSTEGCILGVGGTVTCPPNPVVPTTTHPDQHDAIYVPDGNGGVTLVVGNDGGVYTQHADSGQEFEQARWGEGNNEGFNTLLPYSAAVAKDGTVWYGLQDNGTGKIEGSTLKQFMTFGGDGTFVMTDPSNSDVAYSSTPGQDIRSTTNGGTDWREQYWESNFVAGMFVNPFVMDPLDANHLMTGTEFIEESTFGPETGQTDPNETVCQSSCPAIVFDLTTGDPDNVLSSLDLHGDAAYVGYCGPCTLLNQVDNPFLSGIATNVGGDEPPNPMTEDGWHFAAANGLPERFITSVAIDPNDPNTVYVALGGYENRQWRPPGSFEDPNTNIGTGHLYVSHDAGQTFTDISANLPDAPAFWVEVVGKNQLVVGTQVGLFLSDRLSELGTSSAQQFSFTSLNRGLPSVPIASIQPSPADPSLLVVATYGRGIYTANLDGCGKRASKRPGNQIVGTHIKDRIKGTPQRDVICGKQASDRLRGLKGRDLLIGGGGKKTKDRLNGGKGNDLLRGQGGKDFLRGAKGRDRLIGGGGKDTCFVGKGDVARGCERERGPGA